MHVAVSIVQRTTLLASYLNMTMFEQWIVAFIRAAEARLSSNLGPGVQVTAHISPYLIFFVAGVIYIQSWRRFQDVAILQTSMTGLLSRSIRPQALIAFHIDFPSYHTCLCIVPPCPRMKASH